MTSSLTVDPIATTSTVNTTTVYFGDIKDPVYSSGTWTNGSENIVAAPIALTTGTYQFRITTLQSEAYNSSTNIVIVNKR